MYKFTISQSWKFIGSLMFFFPEAKGYDCDIESEAESSFEEVSAKSKCQIWEQLTLADYFT